MTYENDDWRVWRIDITYNCIRLVTFFKEDHEYPYYPSCSIQELKKNSKRFKDFQTVVTLPNGWIYGKTLEQIINKIKIYHVFS
jgi:hypothetical protein